MSRNLLSFNFMKSKTMNVSNVTLNNVNIALANNVMKQLKSIYTSVCSWLAFIKPIETRPQN